MFTKLFFKLVTFQIRVSIFFCGCPASYNEKKKVFYATKRGVLKYWLHVAVISGYIIFLAIQLVRMRLTKDMEQFNLTMAFFCACIFVMCAFMAQIDCPETSRAANGLLKYCAEFHGKYTNFLSNVL